jgi:hypothetical protein
MRQCQQRRRRHLFQQVDPHYHRSSRSSEAACRADELQQISRFVADPLAAGLCTTTSSGAEFKVSLAMELIGNGYI